VKVVGCFVLSMSVRRGPPRVDRRFIDVDLREAQATAAPSLSLLLCGPPGDDPLTPDGLAVVHCRSEVTHLPTGVINDRDGQRDQDWGQHDHKKAEKSQIATHCCLIYVVVELNWMIAMPDPSAGHDQTDGNQVTGRPIEPC
jgi:hypothetical protein